MCYMVENQALGSTLENNRLNGAPQKNYLDLEKTSAKLIFPFKQWTFMLVILEGQGK